MTPGGGRGGAGGPDGRNIDPRLGVLAGEAAGQRGGATPRLPVRPAETADGESPTYYDRPAIKEPVWIWAVPAYFHAGGVTAGAALLAAVTRALDGERHAELVAACRRIAAAGAVASTGLLIHDLGRPARFLNMLRVFRPTSAMSMGSWTLAAAGALTGATATLAELGTERSADAAGVAAAAVAPMLGTYTGVLLGDTAVPVWHAARNELPALFGASALAGTAALLDLLAVGDDDTAQVVNRVGVAAAVADLAAGEAVERAAGGAGERVARPLHEGVSGTLWRLAKVLTALGLLLRLLPLPARWRRAVRRLSGVLGTAGGLALRFGVVHAGTASARDPRATFEPQRRRLAGRTGPSA